MIDGHPAVIAVRAMRRTPEVRIRLPDRNVDSMNKKQLTHFEKRLLEERARVMKELGYYDESFNATLQGSDGDLSSYSFHMADQGTDAMEREKQFLFASQEGRYLWHVNQALRRLYSDARQVRQLPPVRQGDRLRAARRAAARAALHHVQGEGRGCQAALSGRALLGARRRSSWSLDVVTKRMRRAALAADAAGRR